MIAHGGSGRIFSLHAYTALHNCLGPIITPHIQRTCLALSTCLSDILSWGCQGFLLPWAISSVHVEFYSFKYCRNTEPNSVNSSFQLSGISRTANDLLGCLACYLTYSPNFPKKTTYVKHKEFETPKIL